MLCIIAPFNFGLSRLRGWMKHLYSAALLCGAGYFDYTYIVGRSAADGPQEAFFGALILFVVVTVLNEYYGPKPELTDAQPGGIGDFSFPTATEGRVVSIIWGENEISGPNVIWHGDIEAVPILQKVATGLWSSEEYIRAYSYILGMQMAICRGPGVELVKVMAGDKVVYDGTPIVGEASFTVDDEELFGGETLGTGGLQCTVDFYPGSDTQSVNSYLNTVGKQIISGVTAVAPRYTGTSYVVVRGLDGSLRTDGTRGAYVGTTTTPKPWSFVVRRYPALFTGQSAGDNKMGADANPVNVLYEILTNREWGLGFLAGDIDTGAAGTFTLAADECIVEGNGFSMVLDRSLQAVDLVEIIERQIDGLIYMNPLNGKWSISLARANTPWTSASPRSVDENNASFTNFTRGSWEDTSNEIQIKYWNRVDNYKESHVVAHDMANIQIQGAGTVQTGIIRTNKFTYPGVKTGALALSLCWRTLRVQSFPLARVTFRLDRTFYDIHPGEVVHWTNASLGFVDLPMRISTVNFGTVNDGFIECNAAQDIFKFSAPSYGSPGGTSWQEPTLTVVAFPSDQQIAYECPLAIVTRDPAYSAGSPTLWTASEGVGTHKVFCAARRQGIEAFYEVRTRTASGVPSGTFAKSGKVAGFILIGELDAAITDGDTYPTSAITVDPTLDSRDRLIARFAEPQTLADMGQSLAYLVQIGNEYVFVSGAAINGLNADFTNVYRGVMDTAQANHPAGTKVYLLFAGASPADSNFTDGFQVDVKFLPVSSADILAEAAATTVNFTFNSRVFRPYLPPATRYNGSGSDFGVVALEGAGSGLNGFRIDVDWRRRSYDTGDELAALLADTAPTLPTEYELELRSDPTGANSLIETKAFVTGTGTLNFTRLDILENTAGVAVGVEVELRIRSRHDVAGLTDLLSSQTFTHRFTPTSGLTGQFALGKATATNPIGTFTVTNAGVHTVNIGTAYSVGAVEVSINGGGFSSIIATGLTTGVTGSLSTSDTIDLRHAAADGVGTNFVEIRDDAPASVGYGLFLT